MSLLKADMEIATLYASLVGNRDLANQVMKYIHQEYELTCSLMLKITGHQELMDGEAIIQKVVHLRNPYVDPLNYLQVEVLRRLRSLDNPEGSQANALREVMVLTINGISAGLRNTG